MRLEKIATFPVSIANPGDTLNMAIQRMWQCEYQHLPVVANGRLVGMLSERAVLLHAYGDKYAAHELAHVDPKEVIGSSRVDDVMSTPVYSLSPTDPIESAASLMMQHGIHAVPIVEFDSIQGIVTEADLLKCFLGGHPLGLSEQVVRSSVTDLMSSNIYSVREHDLKPAVVRLMRDKNIRHVPVVDDEQRLVGIISETDCLLGCKVQRGEGVLLGRHRAPLSPQGSVAELMTTELAKADLGYSLRDAAKLMVESRISSIPIVNDGLLVGIITSTDLLRTLVHTLV